MSEERTETVFADALREALDRVDERSQARAERAHSAANAPPASYRPAIVTFIDILGFKEMIARRPAHEIHEILSELRDWSSGELEDPDSAIQPGLASAIAFSDNVVRACPIDGDMPYGALFHELLTLVHIQAKLIERGVFLRGGVTVDNIYMARGEVFGPGLVRAYELESKMAIYPRIVVDPKVIESYFTYVTMRGHHGVAEDFKALEELVRMADDGLYFVDYLSACRSEISNPETGYIPKLREHAGYIVAASDSMEIFSPAKQKYAWLATYHNVVVDETDDASDDCKVNLDALSFPGLARASQQRGGS